MDGFRNTVTNVNRTVHHIGTASETAALEAPRFNNNLNNLNQNAASGISAFDNQAGRLNETAKDAVDEINALNETVTNGLGTLDQQAGEFNKTASDAAEDVARIAASFESTSDVVNIAVEMWAPSILTFLQILGPTQYVMAAHYFVLILKTLGVVQSQGSDAQAWKELRVTNTILQGIADDNREKNLPGIVQNITKQSIVYDETTKTILSHFFYSKNNIVAEQLRGIGYFAYDSIPELFEKVYVWNAFADAANATDPDLSNFNKRQTRIHFLDPYQNPKVVLSHMEFTKIHQNVTIVNHHKAQQHVTLESIKVQEGCCLTLKYVSVCKIDATYGGKAILRQCHVGWNQVTPSPVPFLFGGRPEMFDNPYNVCGTVFCSECTTFDPSRCKSEWKGLKGVFKRPSDKYVSFPPESTIFQTKTKATVERTITNISDEVWHVRFKVIGGNIRCDISTHTFDIDPNESIMLPPSGGSISFSITSDVGAGRFFSAAKALSGSLIFVDNKGNEYWHNYKGLSNLTDYTIIGPAIEREKVVSCTALESLESEFSQGYESKNAVEDTTHPDTQSDSDCGGNSDNREKKNTIVVVGRFGSGKSTFLNTLAGVNWIVTADEAGDRKFVAVEEAKEKFATSRSVKGCTMAAVSDDIITFDGREVTVIDTVGYEDAVNADSLYNDSKLTEVMDLYKEISAVVIVVNSQDPRLTRGFMESLACVPTSFKAKVQKNIVLVFTKWTEDDEEEFGDIPFRGFTEQVKLIRSVLGFDDDDEIKAFWVDNRPFKKYEKACRTIDNLTKFLDHLAEVPRLSCPEFKEMRALSQFERVVRKEFKRYFHQSNQNEINPSGFEKFLYKCAERHEIKKVTWTSYTAKAWSDKLVGLMAQEIEERLPEEVQKICSELAVKFKGNSIAVSGLDSERSRDMAGRYITQGIINGGFVAIVGTSVFSFGLSLCALPGCLALAYAHSKTWSRNDVLKRVVFKISEEHGDSLCAHVSSQFSSHVDTKVEELQKVFESL